MGAFMNEGLTMKTGQTHVHRYLQRLLDRIQQGDIDPTFVITHSLPLEQAPRGYKIFEEKKDSCIKIVLKPWQTVYC
jgi:threonine dehydrogenase-like Zn-dependent dehydrogenase